MMIFKWIDNIDDFRALARDWDLAVHKAPEYNIFLSSNFILSWWKHYHSSGWFCFLLFKEGENIIGGIPFYVKRESWKRFYLRFMYLVGDEAANYTEPLFLGSSKQFFSLFFDAIMARRDWDIIRLPSIRESCYISQINSFYNPRHLFIHREQNYLNWAVNLSQGFENYFQRLSRRFKRDIRAKKRKIENDIGKLTLHTINRQNFEFFFSKYVNFSKKSFRKRDRVSNFERKSYSNFFKDLFLGLLNNNELSGYALMAGSEVIAVLFGYQTHPRVENLILIGFNHQFNQYRPGYLLTYEILREMAASGKAIVNMYGGGSFYKQQWSNLADPLYHIDIHNKHGRTRAFYCIRKGLRSLKKWTCPG